MKKKNGYLLAGLLLFSGFVFAFQAVPAKAAPYTDPKCDLRIARTGDNSVSVWANARVGKYLPDYTTVSAGLSFGDPAGRDDLSDTGQDSVTLTGTHTYPDGDYTISFWGETYVYTQETCGKSENFHAGGEKVPPPSHFECQNYSCVKIDGAGNNYPGCTSEGQSCGSPPARGDVLVQSNLPTSWTINGPGCPSGCAGSGTSKTHSSLLTGTYSIANVPEVGGYTSNVYAAGDPTIDYAGDTVLFIIQYTAVTPPPSPTRVDIGVVVSGGPGNARWQIDCPSGANCASGTGAWSGSKEGGGSYTITPAPASGYTLKINGAPASSNTASVPDDNTAHSITWTIEYTPIDPGCENKTIALTSAATTTPGALLQVTWQNPAGGCSDATDWIALVPSGAGWTSGYPWAYWNGSATAPSVKPPATGSLSLVVPAGVSKLQFVYYRANGYTEGGRSGEITVTVTPPPGCEGDPSACVSASLACKTRYDDGTVGAWSAGPCTVPSGDGVNLQWTSLNADGCTAGSNPSGLWSGAKSISGTDASGPVTQNGSVFRIICTGGSGATSTAQVTVNTGSVPPPPGGGGGGTLNLQCASLDGAWSAGPCSVATGEDARLKWTSTGLATCTATGDWSGTKPVEGGPATVGPIDASKTYGLTCAKTGGGTIADSVIVNPRHTACDISSGSCRIVPGAGENECASDTDCGGTCVGAGCPPPGGSGYCSFSASNGRLIIPPPKSSMLSWNCTGVENCSISEGVGSVGTLGSQSVTPSQTTTYNLACHVTGTAESTSDSAIIRVFKFEGGLEKEILPR
ncbi:MAG: hypothetical protein A2946_01550 [Candidatus Liptonbacteria bacterium RIFCSPLOWO2_01_FULL_53_13]|uniref:Uncharacterized protein n=1 Tax=Candidatus Liptonbacteria bacterium RIFCSPLOWO2_01_FULL_53_13 TaxID=1798651 RepID=A0A1G2CPP0_9BACT|nr:MAG: hypothetical protein A2946_01550 [Candidatus Liptonbacteria bacterium RIFCSPLOWO2_01_FULL_53_13]